MDVWRKQINSCNLQADERIIQSYQALYMNNSNETKNSGCHCDHTLAFLVLRLWLAVRAIVTGIDKFSAYKSVQTPVIDPVTGMEDPSGAMINMKVKAYAMTNYAGIPAPLKDKLNHEPLLPHFAMSAFDHILGPVFIITGVMLLLGLGTRISLFVQGLVYIALTFGLILINQNDGVSWLGVHIALIAFALMLAKNNKFALLKKW
jgi:thiosulfate dehydrogenase [quinone] large subunit